MSLPSHVIKCAGAPVSAPTAVGQHWINTLTGEQFLSNGTASVANWIIFLETPFQDPMTTRGDIIVRDASNDTERLPVGTIGQVFKTDGVDVFWADESGGGVWGDITGTLSDQTDLQNALDAKEGTITAGTTSQYWRGDKSFEELTADVIAESAGRVFVTPAQKEQITKNIMSLSTACIDGCRVVPAISGAPGLFDMGVGLGINCDQTTTPGTPIFTLVVVPERLDQTVTNIGTQFSTNIQIDISGFIVQGPGPLTPSQRRDRFSVASLIHVDGVNISDVVIAWLPGYDTHAQMQDLMVAIGVFLTGGNEVSGVSGSMELDKAAGTVFAGGINVDNNVNDPSNAPLAELLPMDFLHLTQNGVIYDSGTVINPNEYDNNGTITALSNQNRATIGYVFIFANNDTTFLPGQTEYASFEEAVGAVGTEIMIIPPLIANAILMVKVVMRGSATDMTDAAEVRIVAIQTAVGGGGVPTIATYQSVYNASPQPQVLLNGQGGVIYQDAATPLAEPVMRWQNNALDADYLKIENDKVTAIELVSEGLTTLRAVVSDGSKKLVSSVTTLAELAFLSGTTSNVQGQFSGKEPTISSGTTAQYWRGDKSFQTLDKAAVGLGNADNTSDLAKPISTATQSALDDKEPEITSGATDEWFRGDKTFQFLNTPRLATLDQNGTDTLNWDEATVFRSDINGNLTLTSLNQGGGKSLSVSFNAQGTGTPTFTGVLWPDGNIPDELTNGQRAVASLIDDGTAMIGVWQRDIS